MRRLLSRSCTAPASGGRCFAVILVAVLLAGGATGSLWAEPEHHEAHHDEHDDGHSDEHHDEHDDGHSDEHRDEHDDGHSDEHRDEHDDEHAAEFTIADFEAHGVELATAVAGSVDVGIELPGEVRPNADRVAHLAPRFPGLVREVRKGIGDKVRKGEVLARIESDNLSTYDMVAGFDGVIIDKHIAPGESVTRETPGFVVADLSSVWVDINVYQKALPRIRLGQSVVISTGDETVEASGTIGYVAPVVDQATRTATARVVLDNRDGRWRPGLFVIATVSRSVEAAVVVTRRALHSMDDVPVVFVEEGGIFVARPVTVGTIGRTKLAVVTGLKAGERYADANSFLVKAELAKGEGGHEH